MKPIRLMMRAFGPYKDEQVLDFRELGDHRLFAISGKTGAGKTTIFDGIAFALYGNGSGADREDTKNLRSQFADEKVHTAVELTFESKGQTYRIFRQLPHKKKGNKSETGDKITFFEIDAQGNEIPACKPKLSDVRLKVEEILGLSYDQFNQIVMLPQGEFRKLLTSDTKNKEKILRKVFKTERYDQIAQKLEDKKRAAEDEAKLARKMRDQYIEQIAGAIPQRESQLFTRLAEHSNIFQILEALTVEQVYYEEKVQQDEQDYKQLQDVYEAKYAEAVAAKQQNEELLALQQKREQLAELETQRPHFNSLQQQLEQATNAAKIQPIYQTLELTKKELAVTSTKYEQAVNDEKQCDEQSRLAKQRYDEQQQLEPQRIQLANEMNELEKVKPIYEEIEQLQTTLPQLEQQVKVASEQLAQDEQQLAELKEVAHAKRKAQEEVELQVASLPAEIEKAQQLKELIQAFSKWDEASEQVILLEDCAQLAKNAVTKAQQHYEQQQQQWIHHRAYELASQLVPGEACPVCGSTEHQSLQKAANQVDKKALEQAQNALEVARNEAATVQAQLDVAREQSAQYEQQLVLLQVDIKERAQHEASYAEQKAYVQYLTKQSSELQQQKLAYNELLAKMEQAEQQIKVVYTAVETAKQQQFTQQTLLETKQQAIPSTVSSLVEIQTLVMQKKQQYEVMKRDMEQAEKQHHDVKLQLVKIVQTIAHLQEQQQQLQQKETTVQQQLDAALAQYQFLTVEPFLAACRSEQVMQQMQQQLQVFTEQLSNLQHFIAEQQKKLEGKSWIDLTVLEEALQQQKEQVDQALVVLNAMKGYAASCKHYKEKLESVAGEIDRLEKYSGEIVQLYKVLVGQNDEFISFERFIQIGYLEQITEAANQRLSNLSNGQFSLRCSDRKEGNRRQSGLSLDVYDSYTGLPRDVKSLSGGEKFNASLCLALGLADIIQSFQGNVRIDTMFIDEGFGSLDEESLMRAIDVLIELQKSGRIVGVISHVEELKEAMPAIIQIDKLKAGYSQAKIIVK